MAPLDHLGPDVGRNVEFTVRASTRCGPGSQSRLDIFLDLHFNGMYEDFSTEDGVGLGFSDGILEVPG